MRRVVRLLSVLVVLLGSSSALAEKRDLTPMPKVAAGSVPIGGQYRTLIIGIDKYQDRQIPTLSTAVKDATAVRDLLIGRYGFKSEHVKTLFNEQATRVAVEGAMYALGQQARPDDSVLIYYAGHGQTDNEKVRGWWVPFDAKADEPATFIKNASVRDEIAAMKAKHVYLVADSCFSGTLFAQSRSMPAFNDKFFDRLYQSKSRWGLTSGMNEPVADAGKGGHSIFAYFFLKVLRENEDPYVVPSHIYDQLAPLVGRNAEQQPRSEPLQGAGDEGGQFVFRLATGVAAKQPPAASVGPVASAALESERQRLQAEREAFEQEKRDAEERAKMEAERRRMEEERKRFAEEQQRTDAERQKKVQEARVLPYDAVRSMIEQSNTAGLDAFNRIKGAPVRTLKSGTTVYSVTVMIPGTKECLIHVNSSKPTAVFCIISQGAFDHAMEEQAKQKFEQWKEILVKSLPSGWTTELNNDHSGGDVRTETFLAYDREQNAHISLDWDFYPSLGLHDVTLQFVSKRKG